MTESEYQQQQTDLLVKMANDARSGKIDGNLLVASEPEYEADPDALEPQDENPLDTPNMYNPLNHAYPMGMKTDVGMLEIWVKFLPIQGKDLPTDLIGISPAFQIPVSVEDVFITDPELDLGKKEELEDQVQCEILKEEVANDKGWYLVPTIVRAIRMLEGEKAGKATGEQASKEEAARLITPIDLLQRIRQYRDQVSKDDSAPIALLDLLMHFDAQDAQQYQTFPSHAQPDMFPGMDGKWPTSSQRIDSEWDDGTVDGTEDDLEDDDDWDDDDDDWDDDDDDDDGLD